MQPCPPPHQLHVPTCNRRLDAPVDARKADVRVHTGQMAVAQWLHLSQSQRVVTESSLQRARVYRQDYRPGTNRADVEAEQRRQRRLDGRGGAGDDDDEPSAPGRRPGRWEPTADPVTGQNADGSFSRTRASCSNA